MGADILSCVLEATGYLPSGEPAPGTFSETRFARSDAGRAISYRTRCGAAIPR